MKPFDLSAALAGAEVVTGEGEKVYGFTRIERLDTYKLIGFVLSANSPQMRTWTDGGKYVVGIAHTLDLFMAPTKKTGWIARTYNGDGIPIVKPYLFDSEENARRTYPAASSYHQIEWEE
jgi:hypothetical protein